MARRRRAPKSKPIKHKIAKLDKEFPCPFCNHEESVTCYIDKKDDFGELSCRICEAKYSVKLKPLLEPIDIYHEWIDECERINQLSLAK